MTQLQFCATNGQSTPVNAYVNVWFDWNRDGDWDDLLRCAVDPVTDALVRSGRFKTMSLVGAPGFNPSLFTPLFRSIVRSRLLEYLDANNTYRCASMRRITEVPFSNPLDLGKGGSGTVGGYQFGETEDYFLNGETSPVPAVGGYAYQFGETDDYLPNVKTSPVPAVGGWGLLALSLRSGGRLLLRC